MTSVSGYGTCPSLYIYMRTCTRLRTQSNTSVYAFSCSKLQDGQPASVIDHESPAEAYFSHTGAPAFQCFLRLACACTMKFINMFQLFRKLDFSFYIIVPGVFQSARHLLRSARCPLEPRPWLRTRTQHDSSCAWYFCRGLYLHPKIATLINNPNCLGHLVSRFPCYKGNRA